MYCSNCGSQLKETDIFCSKCGHKQGNENKPKEPIREEVVFNTSSQREKPASFPEQEPANNNYEREYEHPFQAPREAHQSVNNARGPGEDDFVWNVHQFPETGPRETEDIDFRWEEAQPPRQRNTMPPQPQRKEPMNEGKFHTYNKSREEFQGLLDKEYLRQNREPEYPLDRGPQGYPLEREPKDYPLDREPQSYPTFEPADHFSNMERQREDTLGYPADSGYYEQDGKRFNTVELQKDLVQPEMDEMAKTQVIEKIRYGDEPYRDQDLDFEVKKTQFVEDEERNVAPIFPIIPPTAPSIPPMGTNDFKEDLVEAGIGRAVEPSLPDDIPTIPQTPVMVNTETQREPAIERTLVIDSEKPIDITPEPNVEKVQAPDMDERLSKLWDSDTAPVPIASLVSETLSDKKPLEGDKPELYDPMDETYEDYEEKEGRRWGFLGKFVIAIIIIVLIIEGSILGLRNFAPESEATAKANQVILTLQNWIEDTFFDKK